MQRSPGLDNLAHVRSNTLSVVPVEIDDEASDRSPTVRRALTPRSGGLR